MPDAPEALDVVPAGPPEQGGVYAGVPAHGPVGQVVDVLNLSSSSCATSSLN